MAVSDDGWRAAYQDPLRWRFPDSGEDNRIGGVPRTVQTDTEFCTVHSLVMHRPTHDAQLERSGRYPFSEHLSGRRRLWEVRMQVQFRQPPTSPIFFGIELGRYVPVSGLARQVQKALVGACRSIVGDCYHATGDAPGSVAGEAELPTFVMPLWAFDQFHVAEAGAEPDLTGSLEGVGLRRTDGVKKYIEAMKAAMASITPDKVYTFCFWGVSQFLDCLRWEVVGGLIPGVKIDFNKLCGAPPVYLTMYELVNAADGRHFSSRKRRFFHAAVWSALQPPADDGQFLADGELNVAAPAQETAANGSVPVQQAQDAAAFDLLGLCDPQPAASGAAGGGVEQLGSDLLGLDLGGAPGTTDVAAPQGAGQPKAGQVETADLLGIF